MHRTEGTNHNGNMFTDGPPGTTVEQDWLNAVQEEIAYVIEQSGGTLKTAATETSTQLKTALDALYEPLGAPYAGVLVYRTAVQSIPNNTDTNITWDAESYDTNEIHSLVTNPERLTVPASITKIKLHGQITYDVSAVGERLLYITKNGVTTYTGHAISKWDPNISVYHQIHSPVITVVGGDYFALRTRQASGGALDAMPGTTGSLTWFAMELIE